jgi:hypothetical protein
MTCSAVLFEPWFGNFLFNKVFEEFMDNVNVALQVNGVYKENGPNNPMARHCTFGMFTVPLTSTSQILLLFDIQISGRNHSGPF